MRRRKVLVTGGAGFIGSHTVDALVDEGAEVVVVDDLSTGRKENLNPGAKLYHLNVADAETAEIVRREQPDVVYHFAFYVLVPRSTEDPLLDVDVLTGTLRILQECARLGIEKFVFSSSGFVYGNRAPLPASEECPVDPVSPYVVSKVAIENYLRFYHQSHGLSYVVLRYSAVYGPRQVTGAMADYIRRLSHGEQADMWGDGEKTRDYVFIDDVVRANLLALRAGPDSSCAVLNVGTGTETTLNELYRTVARLLGKEAAPIHHEDRPGEQVRYCLDPSRIRSVLGWEPDVDIESGLRRTVDYWRSKEFGL